MKNENISSQESSDRITQNGKLVGVRGCRELIIKLILFLIIISYFIYYYQRQVEVPISGWLLFLLIIILFITLIWIQRHFIFLNCRVDEPTGCKDGDPNILANHVLEPIIGTASGLGFSHYEIELLWNGTLNIPNAIIYADAGGNPDTTLTNGNHQVNSGTLGFVDLQKAALGAGTNILSSTDFELRLHVIGYNGSRKTCTSSFSIVAARAYIKNIGGGIADDVIDPNEILRFGGPDEATIGGSFHIRGAADVFGCTSTEITEYSLWVKEDPTHILPQPVNGTAFDAVAAGWTNITTVTYSTANQRTFNKLDGMPNPDILTNNSVWGTEEFCISIFGTDICINVPNLNPRRYNSDPGGPSTLPTGSGKYTFLLKMEDNVGNTYYDIQRAWIDNERIRGKISGLGGVAPCADIYILDLPNPILPIEGFATDPLIIPGDITSPTSDNFDRYEMSFQKQGAPTWVDFDIPLAVGSHGGLIGTNPVPDRATWSGGAGDPPTGILAEWDLRWLDAATNPKGLPANQLLAADESCTYNIRLQAWDKTIVSEHHRHWTGVIVFPVKIHNGRATTP